MQHDATDRGAPAPAPSEQPETAAWARWIGALGAGALAAVGIELATASRAAAPPPVPGPVALWAADRDASRVVALDEELIVRGRFQVDFPVELEGCDDGSAWVVRSSDGTPAGVDRLARLTPTGVLETEVATGLLVDLAVLDGRDALVVEYEHGTPDSARALRVVPGGGLHVVCALPGLACISGSDGTIALGTADGSVVRIDPQGDVLEHAILGGHIGDLAPGPRPGTLWALDTSGPRRLVLLDRDLTVVRTTVVGLEARHLAPVPGEERVWIADTGSAVVRRYGPGGSLEVDRELPLAGLGRAIPWKDRGAVFAAPGAILHVDEEGDLAPGQGGFDFLSDLATAR